jgi:hypothetical protein
MPIFIYGYKKINKITKINEKNYKNSDTTKEKQEIYKI